MSLIKKQLQCLYDDSMFYSGNIIAEQMILGKKYKFIEPFDRQSQQQWQEERKNEFKTRTV